MVLSVLENKTNKTYNKKKMYRSMEVVVVEQVVCPSNHRWPGLRGFLVCCHRPAVINKNKNV